MEATGQLKKSIKEIVCHIAQTLTGTFAASQYVSGLILSLPVFTGIPVWGGSEVPGYNLSQAAARPSEGRAFSAEAEQRAVPFPAGRGGPCPSGSASGPAPCSKAPSSPAKRRGETSPAGRDAPSAAMGSFTASPRRILPREQQIAGIFFFLFLNTGRGTVSQHRLQS